MCLMEPTNLIILSVFLKVDMLIPIILDTRRLQQLLAAAEMKAQAT